MLLKSPMELAMALGSMRGYVTDILFGIFSLFGFMSMVYFSILLIIDTIKTIHKK